MKGRPPRYVVEREFGKVVLKERLTDKLSRHIFASGSLADMERYVKDAERYADGVRRAYERAKR